MAIAERGERRVCADCHEWQVVRVRGGACRYCGSRHLRRSLGGPREGAAKDCWEQALRTRGIESVSELSEPARKLYEFLREQGFSIQEFVRRFNSRGYRSSEHQRLSYGMLKFYVNGQRQCPRQIAIRIARMVKRANYPVSRCPFFHPHAAMRVYASDYRRYWAKNRRWFRENPGRDPGDWWNRIEEEQS